MKHTKGPWFIRDDWFLVSESTADVIAPMGEVNDADASLIAAAPEMLEMLILIQMDGYKSNALDALIKKAKGST